MNFNLTDEHQQLADSLGKLLEDHHSFEQRQAIARGDTKQNAAIWAKLSELGVCALGIEEEFDGLGGGARDRLPVMQALGRKLALLPYLANLLCATAIRSAGSQAQKAELLPQLAAGQKPMAWAHNEARARHLENWVEMQARQVNGEWQLSGDKTLVLHGDSADAFVVTARSQGQADDPQGLALFLVNPKGQGVSVRPYRLIDDTPAADLSLNNAPAVPLGDAGNSDLASTALAATLAAGKAAVCADMVGAMETAVDLTKNYVNTRQQFGKLIGEYQALRHRIADMQVSLEVSRSMAIAAAVAVDDPFAPATDLPRAKLLIGRQGRLLAQAAIQSHGGIGMTEEYPVGHCLRRIHVLDQLFGDADAQVAILLAMGQG